MKYFFQVPDLEHRRQSFDIIRIPICAIFPWYIDTHLIYMLIKFTNFSDSYCKEKFSKFVSLYNRTHSITLSYQFTLFTSMLLS